MKEIKLFQSRVCFDDYYENPKGYLIYDCWLDANCNGWNGWACPYMEKYEYLRYVNRCIREYFENPEADDGCDGNFIDQSGPLNHKKQMASSIILVVGFAGTSKTMISQLKDWSHYENNFDSVRHLSWRCHYFSHPGHNLIQTHLFTIEFLPGHLFDGHGFFGSLPGGALL